MDGIYTIGTKLLYQKQMPKVKEDKKVFRSESDFQYSKNTIWCKWYDSKPLLRLATNVDDISVASNVMGQKKGSATKTPVSCSNIIKLYNNIMGSVDLMGQETAAYRPNFWFQICGTCKQSYWLHEFW